MAIPSVDATNQMTSVVPRVSGYIFAMDYLLMNFQISTILNL